MMRSVTPREIEQMVHNTMPQTMAAVASPHGNRGGTGNVGGSFAPWAPRAQPGRQRAQTWEALLEGIRFVSGETGLVFDFEPVGAERSEDNLD
jgi:hypothetical protein